MANSQEEIIDAEFYGVDQCREWRRNADGTLRPAPYAGYAPTPFRPAAPLTLPDVPDNPPPVRYVTYYRMIAPGVFLKHTERAPTLPSVLWIVGVLLLFFAVYGWLIEIKLL